MTATMPSAFGLCPRPLSDVKNDKSGAVMITGLFMACFLVGSLWFIMGIGDTVVFRDKMQEAADVGAFTSAALQAKGLNFIALCNLIMLVLVTIHIILGILTDIFMLVCIAFGVETLGAACEPWINMEKVWRNYFKIMKPIMTVLHDAETIASYGYPVIGTIEGLENGRTYGGKGNINDVIVIPVSEGMIPGGGRSGFLPVEAKEMNYLCVKLVSDLDALIQSAIGKSGGGKFVSAIVGKVAGLIGKAIQFRYCNPMDGSMDKLGNASVQASQAEANDKIEQANKKIADNNKGKPADKQDKPGATLDASSEGGGIDPGLNSWWKNKGPMVIFDKGANGTGYFQVYSANVAPSFKDQKAESRVGMGRGPSVTLGQKGMQNYDTTNHGLVYMAQAEFYFNCDAKWADDACNKDDNSTFKINWRARMRRFSLGAQGDKVLNMGLGALAAVGGVGGIAGLGDEVNQLKSGVQGAAGDILNGNGVAGMQDINNLINQVQSLATPVGGGVLH